MSNTPVQTKRRRVPRSSVKPVESAVESLKEPVLPEADAQADVGRAGIQSAQSKIVHADQADLPENVNDVNNVNVGESSGNKKWTKGMRIEKQRSQLLELKAELDQFMVEWLAPVDLSSISVAECTMKDYGKKVLKVAKTKSQKKLIESVSSRLNKVLRTSDTLTKKRGEVSTKLQQITPALAALSGWSLDELKTRKDVTAFIKSYIDEKGLRVDSKHIRLDAALRTAFDIPDSVPDEIIAFRIQAYVPRALKKVVQV
jgi:hypothetical protein